jgi:basic membrane protein A
MFNCTPNPGTRFAVTLRVLCLVGALLVCCRAMGADKIIYIRPVPHNTDVFLQQGTVGVKDAALYYGLEASTLESVDSPSGRQQQLANAVRQKPKFIVLMGYEFKDLIAPAAAQAPQTHFIWVEHCVDAAPANVHCVQFRETEIAYLAGMEAAWASKSGVVGVVGPIDIPIKRKNALAFEAGAKAGRPDIRVHATQWVGGDVPFNDAVRAEALATEVLAAGVDVIYAMAANSNRGVLSALKSQGTKGRALMIGHPANQCHMLPYKVLDSVEVRYFTAISLAVGQILAGTSKLRMEYGLKEGALSLTSLSPGAQLSECEVVKDRGMLEKLKQEKLRIPSVL